MGNGDAFDSIFRVLKFRALLNAPKAETETETQPQRLDRRWRHRDESLDCKDPLDSTMNSETATVGGVADPTAALPNSDGSNPSDAAAAALHDASDAAATTVAAVALEGDAIETRNDEEDDEGAVGWEPLDMDIISGRGAAVNAHLGNKKFRAYCFARKPEFEAANQAAKRRIGLEIVDAALGWGSRFLKRKKDKGPWFEMTQEEAMIKAHQVMRDHRRPDRLAQRESSKKRTLRTSSVSSFDDIFVPPPPMLPLQPIIENPFGVHDHDVLCGRGAFVNGHTGNQRLRNLAVERKQHFDNGNYTEKRTLAQEIVMQIRSLDPPGRFLKQGKESNQWEELNDERAIHKACQVMRDISRPDRKEREERRKERKLKKQQHVGYDISHTVEEAVAEAMDKALEAAPRLESQSREV